MGAVVRAGALEVEADEARVPAVADDRRQHVGALAQQLRDVVRRVLDPLAVVGPAGREHRVADARAVDVQLDDAASGRVEHRRGGPRDARVEPRRRWGAGRQRSSMMSAARSGSLPGTGTPGSSESSREIQRARHSRRRGAEARRLAPRRLGAVLVPYLHAPPAVRRRRQRAPGVHDVDGARRLDAAAVPEGRLAVRVPATRRRGTPSGASRARRTRAPSSVAGPGSSRHGTSRRCSQRSAIARIRLPPASSRGP